MATIFEMARALGEELQKTPQVEALVAAKAAYESDPEIAKLVEEYTKLHYDFEAKMNAGGISIEEQRAFNEQMKAKGEANKGVTPVVPQKGSLGSSGDLAPLAHMTLPMQRSSELRQ